MQIIYDTLLLELPYEILSVQSIRLQGSLNEHGVAEIDFQCKEEDAKNIVLRSMETDKITISENNNRIFTGVLSSIKEKRYKGKTCIRTVWKTATAKMDITKRKLAVTGEDLSFEDILTRITGNYQAGFMDGLHANAMLLSFVLFRKNKINK